VAPFGVYVHIPFCTRRCDYCAFATWTDRDHLMADYAAACVTEIGRADLRPATSVYFGGGTPSLLPGGLLATILDSIPRAAGAEVTVECNPETVTADLLATYHRAGVTRLSFGVQSMMPHVLTSLGRSHTPGCVSRAVALARSTGFESFNLDLIYGAAGESDADWRASLDAVLELDPPHVSAYGLTVEPGTALAADPTRFPDDDDQASKYLAADRLLEREGLLNYEISNWARPGHECAHNLLYWRQGDYRGIGCAAHSHAAGERWWNVRTPDRYIAAVRAGRPPEAGRERLSSSQRRAEALQLAIRTREGVPAEHLPVDPIIEPLVRRRDGRAALTPEGRLVANEVVLRGL
jgi:putative oxygen-independent coproporphyrinogen III oxidase